MNPVISLPSSGQAKYARTDIYPDNLDKSFVEARYGDDASSSMTRILAKEDKALAAENGKINYHQKPMIYPLMKWMTKISNALQTVLNQYQKNVPAHDLNKHFVRDYIKKADILDVQTKIIDNGGDPKGSKIFAIFDTAAEQANGTPEFRTLKFEFDSSTPEAEVLVSGTNIMDTKVKQLEFAELKNGFDQVTPADRKITVTPDELDVSEHANDFTKFLNYAVSDLQAKKS